MSVGGGEGSLCQHREIPLSNTVKDNLVQNTHHHVFQNPDSRFSPS